jgi:hypothetical protein
MFPRQTALETLRAAHEFAREAHSQGRLRIDLYGTKGQLPFNSADIYIDFHQRIAG